MTGLLTEEQSESILKRELKRILQKQESGEALTKAELEIVDKMTIKSAIEKSVASGAYASNQSELALRLGVDRKTVWRWKKNPTFPKAKADGRYNVQEVVQWKEDNGEEAGDLISKESEQVKSIQLSNEKLAIQIGILKKEYTPNSELTQYITEMVISAKRQLLTLPSSLAPQVVGEDVAQAEKIIKSAIIDALKNLSDNKWNEQA